MKTLNLQNPYYSQKLSTEDNLIYEELVNSQKDSLKSHKNSEVSWLDDKIKGTRIDTNLDFELQILDKNGKTESQEQAAKPLRKQARCKPSLSSNLTSLSTSDINEGRKVSIFSLNLQQTELITNETSIIDQHLQPCTPSDQGSVQYDDELQISNCFKSMSQEKPTSQRKRVVFAQSMTKYKSSPIPEPQGEKDRIFVEMEDRIFSYLINENIKVCNVDDYLFQNNSFAFKKTQQKQFSLNLNKSPLRRHRERFNTVSL